MALSLNCRKFVQQISKIYMKTNLCHVYDIYGLWRPRPISGTYKSAIYVVKLIHLKKTLKN